MLTAVSPRRGLAAHLGAGRFVAHLNFDTSPRGIACGHRRIGDLSARVVEPRRPGAVRGTIVAIHGVAPSGNDDARMLAVARAAAGLGFRVVLPEIEAFSRCELDGAALDRISEAIVGTAARGDLCPSGRVSIFSACVSAGLCLVAAARPAVAALVDSMLLIGPYARIDALLDHLMLGDDELVDDYGRVVMLSSWSDLVGMDLDRELRHALWLRILDGHHGRVGGPDEALAGYLASRPATRRALEGLHAREHRERFTRALRLARPEMLRSFSPVEHLRGLRARSIVLVHGERDPIVPSRESVRLADALDRLGGPRTHLCVTPLIGHGDRVPLRPSLLAEAASLVTAFARFFEAAEAVEPVPRRVPLRAVA